jgi:hypothetical protein
MPHNRLVGQRTSVPGVPVGFTLRETRLTVFFAYEPKSAFKALRTGIC